MKNSYSLIAVNYKELKPLFKIIFKVIILQFETSNEEPQADEFLATGLTDQEVIVFSFLFLFSHCYWQISWKDSKNVLVF